MRSEWVVYCEHQNGRVGFSQCFRFRLVALIFAYEQRVKGYKTRVKKEWYEYDD